jgi:hypothetical protein
MKRQRTSDDDNKPLAPITPIQQAFIEHLLTGKTITQSARLAGCSRRAATYWMADSENAVRIEYDKQRAYAQQELDNRVAKIHNLAFTALEDMLSPKSPPFMRMQALKLLYESHLSPLFVVRHPKSPIGLVGSELEQHRKEREQAGFNGIQLWDDRGNERMDRD